jgi:hypothetical protein
MALSLQHFEKIDGLLGSLLRMGDFETCADPRGYIRTSNQLLDACVDAGMAYDHDDHVAWATEAVIRSLVSA